MTRELLIGELMGRIALSLDEVAEMLATKTEVVQKLVNSGRLKALVLDPDAPPVIRVEHLLQFVDSLDDDEDR